MASRVSVHSSRKKELAVLYELEKKYDVKFDYEENMDKKGNMKVKVSLITDVFTKPVQLRPMTSFSNVMSLCH